MAWARPPTSITSGSDWKFVPILFWIVCFLWQIVPVSMVSFQQQFDPGGLLRFPVSFGGFYLLHLIFGLVDASTILGAFCCTGLLIGVSVVRPDLFGWMALALLSFAMFNVFLVRAIFAWIDRWLAQRRTREILTAVFFVGLLGMQLFNPALRGQAIRAQTVRDACAIAPEELTMGPWLHSANEVQRWLPPGLAGDMLEEAQADRAGAIAGVACPARNLRAGYGRRAGSTASGGIPRREHGRSAGAQGSAAATGANG